MAWTVDDVQANAASWGVPVEPMEAFYNFCVKHPVFHRVFGSEPAEVDTAEGGTYLCLLTSLEHLEDDGPGILDEAIKHFTAECEGERQTLTLPWLEFPAAQEAVR